MTPDDIGNFAIPLAVSAALADQEAHWRFEWMMQRAGMPNAYPNTQPLIDLQRRRGRFAELGAQMEQFARQSVCDTASPRLCSRRPMPTVPPATKRTNCACFHVSFP